MNDKGNRVEPSQDKKFASQVTDRGTTHERAKRLDRTLDMSSFDAILFRLVAMLSVAFVGYLLFRIIQAPAGTGNGDASALVQMAQWTIATVLTGGAALIGLSWYQSTKRHDLDREQLERDLQRHSERFEIEFKKRDDDQARIEREIYHFIALDVSRLDMKYFVLGRDYGSFAGLLREMPIGPDTPVPILRQMAAVLKKRLKSERDGENYVYFWDEDGEAVREAALHIQARLPHEGSEIRRLLDEVLLQKEEDARVYQEQVRIEQERRLVEAAELEDPD